jgi:hypothetical protein
MLDNTLFSQYNIMSQRKKNLHKYSHFNTIPHCGHYKSMCTGSNFSPVIDVGFPVEKQFIINNETIIALDGIGKKIVIMDKSSQSFENESIPFVRFYVYSCSNNKWELNNAIINIDIDPAITHPIFGGEHILDGFSFYPNRSIDIDDFGHTIAYSFIANEFTDDPIMIPSTTLPSTTLPSTTLPSTTLPSTTLPSTTLPSTTTIPFTEKNGYIVIYRVNRECIWKRYLLISPENTFNFGHGFRLTRDGLMLTVGYIERICNNYKIAIVVYHYDENFDNWKPQQKHYIDPINLITDPSAIKIYVDIDHSFISNFTCRDILISVTVIYEDGTTGIIIVNDDIYFTIKSEGWITGENIRINHYRKLLFFDVGVRKEDLNYIFHSVPTNSDIMYEYCMRKFYFINLFQHIGNKCCYCGAVFNIDKLCPKLIMPSECLSGDDEILKIMNSEFLKYSGSNLNVNRYGNILTLFNPAYIFSPINNIPYLDGINLSDPNFDPTIIIVALFGFYAVNNNQEIIFNKSIQTSAINIVNLDKKFKSHLLRREILNNTLLGKFGHVNSSGEIFASLQYTQNGSGCVRVQKFVSKDSHKFDTKNNIKMGKDFIKNFQNKL